VFICSSQVNMKQLLKVWWPIQGLHDSWPDTTPNGIQLDGIYKHKHLINLPDLSGSWVLFVMLLENRQKHDIYVFYFIRICLVQKFTTIGVCESESERERVCVFFKGFVMHESFSEQGWRERIYFSQLTQSKRAFSLPAAHSLGCKDFKQKHDLFTYTTFILIQTLQKPIFQKHNFQNSFHVTVHVTAD
jgi:hypothetical protein